MTCYMIISSSFVDFSALAGKPYVVHGSKIEELENILINLYICGLHRSKEHNK